MNMEQAIKIVGGKIAGPRYDHTLRVLDTARELGKNVGVDVKKTEIAAVFHDYAKLLSIPELKVKVSDAREDPRLLAYHPELWHGPVAAQIVLDEFDISDKDILNAIRFHTTGRANMSMLEKVIFLADYIEPGRSFPGVEEVRELVKEDINKALLYALGNTIQFLIIKKALIFPDTFEAYNHLIFKKERNYIGD
ncbi:bis(5'-nucleosyl)-tetraphosphatase (symmetrical) YqeK [Bacillus sp. FSL K6-3431]|uniref:bis(5'-nucleosyl)-tetraphosphatase (symmetrical) YqeK n=1 Tax=Bacillus sp. FSL K6-3431 TaxID=2921500 RepID=UPI0030FC1E21